MLGASVAMAVASVAIRLVRPVRTRPGPISMKVVTPVGGHRLDGPNPVDAGGQVLDQLGPGLGARSDRPGVGVGQAGRVRVVER